MANNSYKLGTGKLSRIEAIQLKQDGIAVRKDGNIVMTASYLEKCGKWTPEMERSLTHSKPNPQKS